MAVSEKRRRGILSSWIIFITKRSVERPTVETEINEDYYISGKADADRYRHRCLRCSAVVHGENRDPDAMDTGSVLGGAEKALGLQ